MEDICHKILDLYPADGGGSSGSEVPVSSQSTPSSSGTVSRAPVPSTSASAHRSGSFHSSSSAEVASKRPRPNNYHSHHQDFPTHSQRPSTQFYHQPHHQTDYHASVAANTIAGTTTYSDRNPMATTSASSHLDTTARNKRSMPG